MSAGTILAPVVLLGLVFLYFLPSLLAEHYNHKNTASIAVINLIAGWTFVGYVIALAWAVKRD